MILIEIKYFSTLHFPLRFRKANILGGKGHNVQQLSFSVFFEGKQTYNGSPNQVKWRWGDDVATG